MSIRDPAAVRLLRSRPRQPDPRSCGAACLVVAEALDNEGYAARLVAAGPDRFAAEVLAMHRRTTGAVDVGGRLQAPWTRLLGTPPWAVARQLSARRGRRHDVHPVLPWARGRAVEDIRVAAAHRAVPLFVGSRLLPRHVVLVLDADLATYDPATGRVVTVDGAELEQGRISTLGWPLPWLWVGAGRS